MRGAETLMPLLREQQAAGRIGHIGITSSSDSQYVEMESIMRRERLDFIQVDYAAGNRGAGERPLPLAADRGMAVLPAVAALGFVALGMAPTALALSALQVVRVLCDSSRHALAKPAREVLFTRVEREQRYKSKAFIDAAVYRGGDLLSGWIYVGRAAPGMTVGAIALAAAPVAVAWALLGRLLGRDEAE